MNNFLLKIKGTALSVLLALYASARSLGASDLARLTGWSNERVRNALRRLQAQGWIEQRSRYHGWTLVSEARQRLYAWWQAGWPEPASAPEPDSRSLEVVKNININTTTTDSDFLASVEKHYLPPLDASASVEKQPLPPIADILRAAEGLFGEPLWQPPQRCHDPQLLLAWIACAYHVRHRLGKPARVVYANLKTRRPPPQQYLDDPLAYLPASFLLAAGLDVPAVEADDQPDEDDDFPLLESAPACAPLDPSLALPVGPAGTGPPAALAWQQALELLRPGCSDGMPVDAYARWVAPAVLLRFHPPAELDLPAVFSIQVPSDFLRRLWLDRLVPTLSRHLCGFCAAEVTIEVLVEDEVS
jgi:hypothetical protein